jgi:hypothetical protein
MSSTFSVELTVLTNDRLRKIYFKLSKNFVKDTEDVDKDENKEEVRAEWTIEFALNERKKESDNFGEEHIIKLKVDLSKELEKKADDSLKGLDDAQAAAVLSAGDALKLFLANKISKKSYENALKRIISRRSP